MARARKPSSQAVIPEGFVVSPWRRDRTNKRSVADVIDYARPILTGSYRGRVAYILDSEVRGKTRAELAALAQHRIITCATAIRGEVVAVPVPPIHREETVRPSGLVVPA